MSLLSDQVTVLKCEIGRLLKRLTNQRKALRQLQADKAVRIIEVYTLRKYREGVEGLPEGTLTGQTSKSQLRWANDLFLRTHPAIAEKTA